MITATPPCDKCSLAWSLLDDPSYRCRSCRRKPKDGPLFTQHPPPIRYRGGHAEQTRGTYVRKRPSASKRFEKNRANRLRRRAEKRDPENAPTRLIRGWYD